VDSLHKTIESLARLPSPGPAPGFSPIHICRALLTIGDDGPIGRIELSRRLAIGEGAIRTIIKHLTQAKVIHTIKNGSVLTKHGMSLYKPLRAKLSGIVFIDGRQLALDKANAAILVRGAGQHVNRGIEQRDAAVRDGATGACTLIVRDNAYVMPIEDPHAWKLERKDPLGQDLERLLQPKDKDAIIVVSARERVVAAEAAMAAALTLLQ
jgi:predicted transcriptional regulator